MKRLKKWFQIWLLSGNGIILLGTLLSLSLFGMEGLLDSLYFKEGSLANPFFHDNLHDTLIHYLPGIFLIFFSGITQVIVKKKFAVESSLKDRENRLRIIFEQVPAILWTTDRNLVITSSSGSGLKELGQDPEQIVGLTVFEYLNVTDSEFPMISSHLKALRGESVKEELQWKHRTYATYLEALRNPAGEIYGCIGIALNVTETVEARVALEASETQMAGILNVALDAIISTDSDQRITLFNTGAEKIFGYTEKEVLGLQFEVLLPEGSRKAQVLHMKKIAGEGSSQKQMGTGQEIQGLKKNGGEFPAEVSIATMGQNGELTFIVILRDISFRKEADELIQHLAYTDPLTGLPNRTKLHDLLEQAIRHARMENKLLAFLLIDLDRFKEVNDTLGHQRGDLLLQEVASRLKTVLRPTDHVARMGGDEFGLVFPVTRGMDATVVAEKVKHVLETPYEIEGIPVAIDASIGIALAPDHGANADALIQRADVAMYTSKETAAGYSVYSTKLDRHSPRRLALMGELRNTIEKGQLCLHYQPQVSLPSLTVEGVEALVRWPHPTFGLIPPDQFIIPAEKTGMIDPLTRWVLGEALRECALWRERGIHKTFSVNLSVRNLQDRHLPEMVEELLEQSGTPADCLMLEVTESAIMADPEKGIAMLNRLNRLGLSLSIDDFGTGYSSLASLTKLPVKELKIDKSFISGLIRDDENAVIVRSTIELSHNLGMKVVAEGVENRETLDRLIELGCDSIQGFHICRPLGGPEIAAWMEKQSDTPQKTARQ